MLMQARRIPPFGSSPAFKQSPHQLMFRGTVHDLPNLSSASYGSKPIGTANADRVIIVMGYAAGDGALNLGCTVGGLTASTIVNSAPSTETQFAFYVIVSSGTTATIAFTSTTILRIIDFCYWTCLLPVGESLFAVQSGITTGATPSVVITIPANGFATSICFERANAVDQTMSINQSFIERADEFANNGNFGAADREVGAQATDIGVVWTLNAASSKVGIIVATFGFF